MRIVDMQGVCPTNYKAGTLLLNRYRPIDIFIFVISIGIAVVNTLLMFYVFKPTITYLVLFVILPPIIGFFLVQPIPNYHNMIVYMTLNIKYQLKDKYFTNLVIKTNKKIKSKKSKKKGENHEEENNEIIQESI